MARYRNGLLLYNKKAGRKGDLENKLAQVLPILSEEIIEFHVVQTTSEQHLVETCEKYASKIDILIIFGGDGTVHQCINAIAPMESRPLIGILPGGTSNDFSRVLNLPQNLQQAAEAIVEGKSKKVDVGKTDDCYFLNFWGIGLVAETSANIDAEQKDRLGLLSYFITTLKTINQAETFVYRVKANGEVREGEAVMVLVLNGRFIGTRPVPVDDIQPDDGKLNILIVKNSTLASFRELMMINQPGIDPSQLTELSYIEAEEAEVESDTEMQVDVDGELNGTTPAKISILPGHVEMIYLD